MSGEDGEGCFMTFVTDKKTSRGDATATPRVIIEREGELNICGNPEYFVDTPTFFLF